ncbi:MAG: S8 family serine peptidase [Actinomycetota bacterium]|nr:S8 family serine peptidase [Actinomycetota bacterium]
MRNPLARRCAAGAALTLALSVSPAVTAGSRFPVTPNDPLFEKQWGMVKIQAPEAWQIATGRGIKIAFVDSGIDLDHEDFDCPGKIEVLPGSNLGGKRPDHPNDTYGHGTFVGAIAGACTNNGTGVVGVAPDATLVPVSVMPYLDDDPIPMDKAMAEGIRFATKAGAHVINLALGENVTAHLGAQRFPLTEAALTKARAKGVVIASAAGNYAQPTCEYPSMSRHVICVVATDEDDLRAAYSDAPVNMDPNSERPRMEPVVAAPGGRGAACATNVYSAWADEGSTCADGKYTSLFGTSASAPHVAGIAALLYEQLGGVRSDEHADLITQTILDTADDLYSPGWDPVVGFGRVNALKAVQALPSG